MSNQNDYDDTSSITITLSADDYDTTDYSSADSIFTFGGSDTITLSDLTDSNVVLGGAGISVPWTTGTSINPNWTNQASSKIQLNGENADIEINGESLVGMLRAIEDRLNILKPNESLESEWEELRALGEQYRALEKHILEKQATWDRLKAMPPPEID